MNIIINREEEVCRLSNKSGIYVHWCPEDSEELDKVMEIDAFLEREIDFFTCESSCLVLFELEEEARDVFFKIPDKGCQRLVYAMLIGADGIVQSENV